MEKRIRISVADAAITAKDFIDVWKRVECGEKVKTEQRLNFENLETLLRTLTTGRWMLLKVLRKKGPMSIRAVANELRRDYKNVHTDVRRLEAIGLVVVHRFIDNVPGGYLSFIVLHDRCDVGFHAGLQGFRRHRIAGSWSRDPIEAHCALARCRARRGSDLGLVCAER